MQAETQAQVAFYLTGQRASAQLDAVDALGLRPALFAGYRNLSELRYDFPLVLVDGGGADKAVQSLSGIFDNALASAARGTDGERVRKHALRIEQEIRTLGAAGTGATFSALWTKATATLGKSADKSFEDSARRTLAAIKVDGAVVDCDGALPARLLQHAWAAVQRQKAQGFRKNLDRLALKLSDILKADHERSAAGRSAKNLQAAVGIGFDGAFDFDAMSRVLAKALPKDAFPESRRKRINELLATLNSQQFIPASGKAGAGKPYSFLFTSCAEALSAFRQRSTKLMALAKAIAMAELEIAGQYSETRHDALFAQFGANGLDPQELAQFPDYLVCANAAKMDAVEQAQLMEILSSGLPIKVLLQLDDILEVSAHGDGGLTTGLSSQKIASMAMGLNEVYVLQTSSSNLLRSRDRLWRGLAYRGPALFSVFSGASAKASDLPPYLVAAAAMESRAFPAFSYDPSAGPNWATRFYLDANSQVDQDWPVQSFSYEDELHQRVSENLAFTLVDFVASDRRYAAHLARVPRALWNGSLITVSEGLASERKGLPDKVPSVAMVDADNVLQKVIVDERLIREARRCLEAWHSLQELGGVHNSHAKKLLAREKRAWEDSMEQAAQALAVSAPAPAPAAAPAAPAAAASAVVAEAEPERSPDEAYIETARCSTCNECTTINGKMFAYDKNQQARIVDINAGSYAQLVEAAESCQVSVIHPGKPRNPKEAGLEELIKRAEAFQ